MKKAIVPLPETSAALTPPLRLVIVGHVDHGKSTLIGRLLHDTGSLPDGKFEAIEKSCKQRGLPFEWAFLMDALQAERDQNVTIETTQIWLKRPVRDTVIIDAPGHREFLKNMVTGAASADAALLVVDAREGVSQQSRTHALLLHMLGIRQVAVVVNKMDAVDYDEQAFRSVEREYGDYLRQLNITPLEFIPVSARDGDNIAQSSSKMPWYKGTPVLHMLDTFAAAPATHELPLRFPVQDVYKSGDKRIIVGRIESGVLRIGDTLLFSPSNAQAKVATIESWNEEPPKEAVAGQSIGITLNAPIFVERGQVASHTQDAPKLTNLFPAKLFWLGRRPLSAGDVRQLKIGTMAVPAEIKTIECVIASDTLAPSSAGCIEHGQVAEVALRTRGQIAVDDHARFVLAEDGNIAGGGIILTEGLYDQRRAYTAPVKSQHVTTEIFGITRDARTAKNGHAGGVLWFTGLSGAGKSTIARLAQKRLFDMGCQVCVLDGDNIRQGLNRDLGFSEDDRHENLRRVAEVAALFAQAGMIVITAFISPYEKDRQLAHAVGPEDFHNIYIKASVLACEKRDVKGLYQKAREGKIANFTGVSAPYEEPKTPDLVLDTEAMDAEACAEALVAYVTSHLIKQDAWKHSDSA